MAAHASHFRDAADAFAWEASRDAYADQPADLAAMRHMIACEAHIEASRSAKTKVERALHLQAAQKHAQKAERHRATAHALTR